MPRGRQYYDPIIQTPSRVEPQTEQRIELYPEQDVRDNNANPKWVARLIGTDGRIVQHSPGSFDHDGALREAQEMWPGLEVFELREESEDSTWDGMGPSPRLWQGGTVAGTLEYNDSTRYLVDVPKDVTPAVEQVFQKQINPSEKAGRILGALQAAEVVEASPEEFRIMPLVIERPGIFIKVDEILTLLEHYAAQFDGENNPSAALGLREAASALREAF